MDIVAAKKDLLRIISRASAVADKKSTMPILANVLLDAKDGTITVRATDLYLSVSGSIPATVKKPGTIALPGKDLLERVKAMPDGPVSLVSADGGATIVKAVGAARRFTLHGIPGADFPTLPQPSPKSPRVEIPGRVLAKLIAQTAFAISPDDTRPNLNSALFMFEPGAIRMVATDGHRLSMATAPLNHGEDGREMLLPLRAVQEVRKLAEDADLLTMQATSPSVFFETASGVLSVKQTEAVFPPYKHVIPKSHLGSASVARLALLEAVRCVSLAASDRTSGVKLTFAPSTLTIKGESPESGDGLDEVPIEFTGRAETVGLNAKYIADVLNALDGVESVIVEMSGEVDPVVIRAVGDDGYTAVVMPMRV